MASINVFGTMSKLILDVTHHAHLIENLIDEDLAAEPSGIYVTGQLEPAMIDGKQYYYSQGTQIVPIKDINEVKTAVYDEQNRLIVRGLFMKNKEKHLSNTCFLPYRGLKIVEILVNDQIESRAVYRKYRKNRFDEIAKHVRAGIDLEVKYGPMLSEIYHDVQQMVASFIEGKDWHLHFVCLKNNQLHIDQGMDYRIWCWEREHGEAFRAGKYVEPNSTYEDES